MESLIYRPMVEDRKRQWQDASHSGSFSLDRSRVRGSEIHFPKRRREEFGTLERNDSKDSLSTNPSFHPQHSRLLAKSITFAEDFNLGTIKETTDNEETVDLQIYDEAQEQDSDLQSLSACSSVKCSPASNNNEEDHLQDLKMNRGTESFAWMKKVLSNTAKYLSSATQQQLSEEIQKITFPIEDVASTCGESAKTDEDDVSVIIYDQATFCQYWRSIWSLLVEAATAMKAFEDEEGHYEISLTLPERIVDAIQAVENDCPLATTSSANSSCGAVDGLHSFGDEDNDDASVLTFDSDGEILLCARLQSIIEVHTEVVQSNVSIFESVSLLMHLILSTPDLTRSSCFAIEHIAAFFGGYLLCNAGLPFTFEQAIAFLSRPKLIDCCLEDIDRFAILLVEELIDNWLGSKLSILQQHYDESERIRIMIEEARYEASTQSMREWKTQVRQEVCFICWNTDATCEEVNFLTPCCLKGSHFHCMMTWLMRTPPNGVMGQCCPHCRQPMQFCLPAIPASLTPIPTINQMSVPTFDAEILALVNNHVAIDRFGDQVIQAMNEVIAMNQQRWVQSMTEIQGVFRNDCSSPSGMIPDAVAIENLPYLPHQH